MRRATSRSLSNSPSLLTVILAAAILATTFGPVRAQAPTTGDPRFDAAVARAAGFLKARIARNVAELNGGKLSLAAYALLNSGVSADDPAIARAVRQARGRVANGAYRPSSMQEHVYEAGVDAMLLAMADPEAHRAELGAISQYLMQTQDADGSWDYPQRRVGDTSMNQYAILGLWACQRASVPIPRHVWERCARWHIQKQSRDGGWAYHPGRTEGPGEGRSTHNMTFGAVSTLAVCRRLLYGTTPEPRKRTELDDLGIQLPQDQRPPVRAAIPQAQIKSAIGRGIAWLTARWRPENPLPDYRMYFYYAMERCMVLNDIETIAGANWYRACGELLVKTQAPTGSWNPADPIIGTSFGILFLVRSTEKQLDLLFGEAGGEFDPNGFPIGKPTVNSKPRSASRLREMEARLINLLGDAKAVPEEDLQELADLVMNTSPKELLDSIPVLIKLVNYPQAEVRERVVLAMGRSGDMRLSRYLIDALDDRDVGVLVQADHALKLVGRKPGGVGVDAYLLRTIDGLSMEEAEVVINAWKKQASIRWRNWYKRVRPWDERDDLWQIRQGGK